MKLQIKYRSTSKAINKEALSFEVNIKKIEIPQNKNKSYTT